jgi:thioredoxin-dependent peroxiredoxin
MLKPGDPAPDFTVQTHEGKPLTLAGFRGKKVLLWFYPEADTPA